MPVFVTLLIATAAFAQIAQTGANAACKPPALSQVSLGLWAENTAFVQSSGKEGLGLVVGWTKGRAWIAVPGHVLYPSGFHTSDASAKVRAALNIRLASDETPRKLCEPGSTPSPRMNPTVPDVLLDLAFVCVEWHGRPLFWSSLMARTTESGARLVLYSPSWEGLDNRGSSIDTDGSDTFGAVGLAGAEGMSGSWVASPAGVVGLYLGADRDGRVLKLSAIQKKARDSEVPWDLIPHEVFDCRRTRRTCFPATDSRSPAAVTLKNANGPSYSLRAGDCVDAAEGKYVLIEPSGAMVCQPTSVALYADPALLQLSITCEPNLTGEWRSDEGHSLTCVASSSPALRTAQCFGLQTLGLGVLHAVLRPDRGRLSLAGSFGDAAGIPHPAEGAFDWDNGRLAGEIRREGLPPVRLVLSRRVER